MLYSELLGVVSFFMSVVGLGLIILNFLNNKKMGYTGYIGIFVFMSAFILVMMSEMYPGRYDFCIDKGYQGQGKDADAEQFVYFCYKIENGTKIMYYYDEYEIRDWEKQQLNKEGKNNEHTK